MKGRDTDIIARPLQHDGAGHDQLACHARMAPPQAGCERGNTPKDGYSHADRISDVSGR